MIPIAERRIGTKWLGTTGDGMEEVYEYSFEPEPECCLICQEELNADGECPNGCTEADDYSFLHGFHFGVDNDSDDEV